MTPRAFIDYFKTRSGRFALFVVIFSAVLIVISQFRQRTKEPAIEPLAPIPAKRVVTSNQVIQTVTRDMTAFRPPPPKPLVSLPPVITSPAPTVLVVTSAPPAQPPTPISLFADTLTPSLETQRLSQAYAPYGRLIPCETVITVDSSSIATPIIGLVTQDIYHRGRLVIPAGTEVHGTAQTDRSRERIASGGSWTLVWQTGEELRLKAIALDREFSNEQSGWGITDGSAGLRGRIIKSDAYEDIKLFAATFLSGAAAAVTEKEATLFGTFDRRSLDNAPLKGAQQVLDTYARRIQEAIQRDGFYVRVPSGKQFYLYCLQSLDRANAALGGGLTKLTETDTLSNEHVAPTSEPNSRPFPPATDSPVPESIQSKP